MAHLDRLARWPLLIAGALAWSACGEPRALGPLAAVPLGSVRPESGLELVPVRTLTAARPLVDIAVDGDLLALALAEHAGATDGGEDAGVPARGGIQLVRWAAGAAPVPLGTCRLDPPPLAVALHQNSLFALIAAAPGDGGIACVDTNDPRQPLLLGRLGPPQMATATALAAGGGWLALGRADGSVAFHRLAAQSAGAAGGRVPEEPPAAFVDLGRGAVTALAFGAGAAARYLYAALAARDELLVVDMENPAGPALCARIAAPSAARLAAGALRLLLVPAAADSGGLLVFELVEPALPRLERSFPAADARAAAYHGELLLVLYESDPMRIAAYAPPPRAPAAPGR